MGFGFLAFPFLVIAHLFCISAVGSFFVKNNSKTILFVINVLGFLYCAFFGFYVLHNLLWIEITINATKP